MIHRKHLTVPMFIVWRALQASVVIPASIVGGVVLFFALTGDAPVQATVVAVHEWAETAVRPAPAGAVSVTECPQPAGEIKPPVLCDSPAARFVPVTEVAEGVGRQLQAVYLILVLMSFGGLVMVRPGRRFVGLSEQTQS